MADFVSVAFTWGKGKVAQGERSPLSERVNLTGAAVTPYATLNNC